ncbi:hypothetical protein MW290_04995 [Aquincola tertiaricarbonis]|uniref:Uncharacterized protein n=1 Tax=Aquincola tertiaricarbonis TaxID=391953 RepID=A0ABY4S694_AQUTE|nr:hypothetical protein [Aquincola tertiaricarbonis]URI07944.1 hypothetical protein MW290_04995 [Aquincola tertiaricarbonis]
MDVRDDTPHPRLQPQGPPGRRNLRARAYAAEIYQLQQQGYTLTAIHSALCAMGVPVSKSTVQREAALYFARIAAATLQPATPATQAAAPLTVAAHVAPKPSGTLLSGDQRSGKEIAEEFMRGQSDNVFLRAKGKP